MLLKLVPDNTNIQFLKVRGIAIAFSLLLVLGSIALIATRGFNFGVDFAGGIMMEVGFEEPADLDSLRSLVGGLNVGEVSLQEFGSPTEVAVRLPLPSEDAEIQQSVIAKVRGAIETTYPEASFRRIETVGGKVSGELVRAGALAILFAMVAISIYIWVRFEWQFGVGALVTLFHDVIITLGFFSLMQFELNLSIVAAVLTIVGYSLNDTIVIYDRIRENLRRYRKMDIAPLIDLSLNETLPRTVFTSLTMVLTLGALLVFGGEVIRGFTAAMLLGTLIGTYSSIYTASPVLIGLKVGPHSFLPPDEKAAAQKHAS